MDIYGYFWYILLFGCFVIWLWVSLIDKNFQFCHCIFLFIFSFYLVVAPTILWRSTLCWCAHFTQCQTKIKLSSCPAWNKKVWKKEEKYRPHIYEFLSYTIYHEQEMIIILNILGQQAKTKKFEKYEEKPKSRCSTQFIIKS